MFPLRNSAAIISKRMSLHHTCYMRVDKEWYRVVQSGRDEKLEI